MNRILEFTPSPEEAVVSRILVMIHQAVDEHFPHAGQATRQFTKTVFSSDGEQTGDLPGAPTSPPDESAPHFAHSEDTSPMGRSADSVHLPPPPALPPRQTAVSRVGEEKRAAAAAAQFAANDAASSRPGSRATGLDTTIKGIRGANAPDWVTRITVALLLAGLVLLAYVLFA